MCSCSGLCATWRSGACFGSCCFVLARVSARSEIQQCCCSRPCFDVRSVRDRDVLTQTHGGIGGRRLENQKQGLIGQRTCVGDQRTPTPLKTVRSFYAACTYVQPRAGPSRPVASESSTLPSACSIFSTRTSIGSPR